MTRVVSWLSTRSIILAIAALQLGGCPTVHSSDEVELRVFLRWFDPELDADRVLPGARLCQTDTSNCDSTDPGGEAAIFVPNGENVSYTLVADGFASVLYANVTDFEFENPLNHLMFTDEQIADSIEHLDTRWPVSDSGWITLGANELGGAPLAGVTVELIGHTNEPWYIDEDGLGTYDLSATTGSDFAGVAAGFFKIEPGEYEVEFAGNVESCVAGRAWPGSAPNRVLVPVRAGHISIANVTCLPADR